LQLVEHVAADITLNTPSPSFLNKADGKRIVLESAQKDTKVDPKFFYYYYYEKLKSKNLLGPGVRHTLLLPRLRRFDYPRQRT